MPCMLDLPAEVLAIVFCNVPLCDICNVACCCKAFRDVVSDDARVWRPLCERAFGKRTCPSQWILEPLSNVTTAVTCRLGTYRCVSQPVFAALVLLSAGYYYVNLHLCTFSRLVLRL